MSELPVGWTHFSLKDIGGLSGGKTPSKANPAFWSSPDITWISPKDMKRPLLESSEDKISQIAVNDAGMTLYPKDSVLMVTRSGILQHTFPVALAGDQLTVNQDIKVLRPSQGISPKFSYYMLKNFGSQILSKCSKAGTTVQSVDSEKLETFRFPLPPLTEQTRIAQKLDELLAQTDTLKARIDSMPALFKRFRQSVLAAAVSGRLTEKWRERNEILTESAEAYLKRIISARRENPIVKFKEPVAPDFEKREIAAPEGWVIASVSSFAECLDSMRVPVKKELRNSGEGLYPYFGANGEVDRVDEYIFDDDLVLVTEDETFYGREKPIAYKYSGKCWVNNHVHALRAHDSVGRDYLCCSLMHYNVFPWLTGTTGRAKLTQGALLSLPIQIPPPQEQAEIVRRVEQLFTFADQLETKVGSAKGRINHLTQSILTKAFRGELVPQDPNDEPASVLLERIKARRAAAPKAKRSRKVST